MRTLLKSCWNSPTITTWLNLSIQSLAFFVLLPLSVRILNEAAVSVFFLLLSVIGLQTFFNLGFQPTFVRLVGYASGGLCVDSMVDLRDTKSAVAEEVLEAENEDSLRKVCAAMRLLNRRIAWFIVLFLSLVGTYALVHPVSKMTSGSDTWYAWVAILVGSFIRIRFSGYQTYLTGRGDVALVQRWQSLFSALSISSMILAMLITSNLTSVIIANQSWIAVAAFCYYLIAKKKSHQRIGEWERSRPDRAVLRIAWRNAWRSGVGMISSKMTQQSLGFFYAQFGSSASVASFLIGMRIIESVENFSMAPFYSRIPSLNRLKARREHDSLEKSAREGMTISHWIYIAGFLVAAVLGPMILNHTGSKVTFPPNSIWLTLGLAFFLQRYGGMHIQLYSTTNHIIWHWVSSIQGVLTIVAALTLAPHYDALGLTVAILIGNFVYAAICAPISLSQFKTPPLRFESLVVIPPFLVFVLIASLELQFKITQSISENLWQIIKVFYP
jgi:O-antigen/teichoic acid export membrane protein